MSVVDHRPIGFFWLVVWGLAGLLVIGVVWSTMWDIMAHGETRKARQRLAERTRRYGAYSERFYADHEDDDSTDGAS